MQQHVGGEAGLIMREVAVGGQGLGSRVWVLGSPSLSPSLSLTLTHSLSLSLSVSLTHTWRRMILGLMFG